MKWVRLVEGGSSHLVPAQQAGHNPWSMDSQRDEYDLTLEFDGPFQWCASPPSRSVSDAAEAGEYGVYVWTAMTCQGELALYVGQTTRSFASRMQEHLIDVCINNATI